MYIVLLNTQIDILKLIKGWVPGAASENTATLIKKDWHVAFFRRRRHLLDIGLVYRVRLRFTFRFENRNH